MNHVHIHAHTVLLYYPVLYQGTRTCTCTCVLIGAGGPGLIIKPQTIPDTHYNIKPKG